jgi:hypothetical protein
MMPCRNCRVQYSHKTATVLVEELPKDTQIVLSRPHTSSPSLFHPPIHPSIHPSIEIVTMKIIPSWLINNDDLVSITPEGCHGTLRFLENACCCEQTTDEEAETTTVGSAYDNAPASWLVTTDDLASVTAEGCHGTVQSLKNSCCFEQQAADGEISLVVSNAAAAAAAAVTTAEESKDAKTSFGLETVDLQQQRNAHTFINPLNEETTTSEIPQEQGAENEHGHFMDDDMLDLLQTV